MWREILLFFLDARLYYYYYIIIKILLSSLKIARLLNATGLYLKIQWIKIWHVHVTLNILTDTRTISIGAVSYDIYDVLGSYKVVWDALSTHIGQSKITIFTWRDHKIWFDTSDIDLKKIDIFTYYLSFVNNTILSTLISLFQITRIHFSVYLNCIFIYDSYKHYDYSLSFKILAKKTKLLNIKKNWMKSPCLVLLECV